MLRVREGWLQDGVVVATEADSVRVLVAIHLSGRLPGSRPSGRSVDPAAYKCVCAREEITWRPGVFDCVRARVTVRVGARDRVRGEGLIVRSSGLCASDVGMLRDMCIETYGRAAAPV